MITNLDLLNSANAAYYTTSTFVADGDVHVVVSQIDDTHVIAFRGTKPNDMEDWFRDFSAWPHEAANHIELGFCHDGFLMGGIAIFEKLQPVLSEKKFVLTGHSLGGALAVVVCGLCKTSGLNPDRLVTFGAPSVGFSTLKNLICNTPGDRVVDGNDPVPIKLLYEHDRTATHIGHDRENPITSHLMTSYKPDYTTYMSK